MSRSPYQTGTGGLSAQGAVSTVVQYFNANPSATGVTKQYIQTTLNYQTAFYDVFTVTGTGALHVNAKIVPATFTLSNSSSGITFSQAGTYVLSIQANTNGSNSSDFFGPDNQTYKGLWILKNWDYSTSGDPALNAYAWPNTVKIPNTSLTASSWSGSALLQVAAGDKLTLYQTATDATAFRSGGGKAAGSLLLKQIA